MRPLAWSILALQLSGAPAQRPADRWLDEDKFKHMLTATAVVGFSHAGARVLLVADQAVWAAAVAGIAAGLWKELHDVRMGGAFSKRDLVWDAVGIALGLTLVSRAR